MSINLLPPALAKRWRRSRARAEVRAQVALLRGVDVEQVQVVRRRDGQVVAMVGAPREQLDLFASKSTGSTDPAE